MFTLHQMDRKPLSKRDKVAAQNLNRIWSEKKRGLGLTQEKAAMELGFNTQGAVSHYLRGYTPLNTDATLKFAKLLKVDPVDIRPDIRVLLDGAVVTEIEVKKPPPPALVEDMLLAPRWDVRASAGHGVPQPESEIVIGGLPISLTWVRRTLPTVVNPQKLAIMTAYGNSMLPTFDDGDVLLVDTGVTDLSIDTVYVVSLNNELFVKRIQRRPGGVIVLKSDNSALYDPYVVPEADKPNLRVLGRVVWTWRGAKP